MVKLLDKAFNDELKGYVGGARVLEINARLAQLSMAGRMIEYRSKHGLSQSDFGFLVGVHRNTIYRIETYSTRPTFQIMHKIESVLDIDIKFIGSLVYTLGWHDPEVFVRVALMICGESIDVDAVHMAHIRLLPNDVIHIENMPSRGNRKITYFHKDKATGSPTRGVYMKGIS